MKIKNLIVQYKNQLIKSNTSSSPQLDAELIICHGIGINSREALILSYEKTVSEEQINYCNSLLERRLKQEPIAYITGKKDFWDHTFFVNEDVLIPRPETELIIESVLKYFPNNSEKLKILDLGTGSGCIGATLLKSYKYSKAVLTDISIKALDVARKNCENLKVINQAKLIKSNWLDKVDRDLYNIIVCNPPYIDINEWELLSENVKNFEPKQALTDYNDGLEHYRVIFSNIKQYMDINSILLLECGYNQSQALENLVYRNGLKLSEIVNDLNNIPRILIIKKF